MSFLQSILDVNDDLAAGFPIARNYRDELGDLDISEPSSLPPAAFALNVVTKTGGVVSKFPLKTPGDTAASVFYFTKNAEELPLRAKQVAATFIKAACVGHQVPASNAVLFFADDSVDDNMVKMADLNAAPPRENLSNDDYALIDDEGTPYFPVNTAERVKLAAVYFHENWKQLHPSYRVEMATKVAARAAELNVPLPEEHIDELAQYDGERYGNILKVAMIERRDCLQHDPSALLVLDQLFEKRAELVPHEFAVALENFDQQAGLAELWDSQIIDPYRSAMGGIKLAAKVEFNGRKITEDQLRTCASSEKVKEAFDTRFVQEFQNDPVVIFESLPTPEKKLIMSLVKE